MTSSLCRFCDCNSFPSLADNRTIQRRSRRVSVHNTTTPIMMHDAPRYRCACGCIAPPLYMMEMTGIHMLVFGFLLLLCPPAFVPSETILTSAALMLFHLLCRASKHVHIFCRKNRNLMSINGHPMGSCKHEPKGWSAYSAPGHGTKVHTTPEYMWRGLNSLARLATHAQACSG
jgi:hypothetical protein